MPKEKVVKGSPGSYLVDMTNKVLGKFDEHGVIKTSDPDTIARIEILERERKSESRESKGERLNRLEREKRFEEIDAVANRVADILIERGIVGGKK